MAGIPPKGDPMSVNSHSLPPPPCSWRLSINFLSLWIWLFWILIDVYPYNMWSSVASFPLHHVFRAHTCSNMGHSFLWLINILLYGYTTFCVSFIRSWTFWVVFGYCEWCHCEYLFTCFSFFNSRVTSLVMELLDTSLNISGWRQASFTLFLIWGERWPSSSWSSSPSLLSF